MKPSELLTKAKAVIADPKHWAQGWYAKDAEGQSVGPAEAYLNAKLKSDEVEV